MLRRAKYLPSILACCLLGMAFLAVVSMYRPTGIAAAPTSNPMDAPGSSRLRTSLDVEALAARSGAAEVGSVVIVSSSYYRSGNFLYLVGEVRNDSDSNVSAIAVTAIYLDSGGSVLGTSAPVPSEHDILIPGQISPFIIFEAFPSGLASYVLVVEASPTVAQAVAPLSVLSIRGLPLAADGLSLVGELQNTQAFTVTNAKLIVTLYDIGGRVINAQSDYVFNNLLVPGQKSPFRVVLSTGPTTYAGRAIGTDAQRSTAVPPDLHSVNVQRHLDGLGALHWTGQVQNRGRSEARLVKAMVTLYDDARAVVNVGVSSTDPSTIGPDQAADFDIVVPEDFTGWTTYSLYPPEDVMPTPTASPTPTITQTPTPTLAATPTPTKTPPCDLLVTGHVYNAAIGASAGISGAAVSMLLCGALPSFETHSGSDGFYVLLVPADYADQCPSVTLLAAAAGYHSISRYVLVADLRAQPLRDFPLVPLGTPTPGPSPRLYLPLIVRRFSRR